MSKGVLTPQIRAEMDAVLGIKRTPTSGLTPEIKAEMDAVVSPQNPSENQPKSKPVNPAIGGFTAVGDRLKDMTEKQYQEMTPDVAQMVSGLAGGMLFPAHPYVASATTGTMGRTAGEVDKKYQEVVSDLREEKPMTASVVEGAASGFRPARQAIGLASMSPEERKQLGRNALRTGMVEASVNAAGAGAGFIVSRVGKAAGSALVGKRVIERGSERGWDYFLNPDHFKNAVPKKVAFGMRNFFRTLDNVTGRRVRQVITSPKYKNVVVSLDDIKSQTDDLVRQYFPDGLQTLEQFDIPKGKADIIRREVNKVMNTAGSHKKLPALWEMRKSLDKVIQRRRWDDDTYNFLNQFRTILNSPIKGAGDDISEAFGRYAFVQESKADLAKKFEAAVSPSGEIFPQKLESFVGPIFGTKKDSTINHLRELNGFLKADDKIIEEFLDYAASEAIDKDIGFGVLQRFFVELMGGGKRFAEIASIFQNPTARGVAAVTGRSIPVYITGEESKVS